MPCHGYDSSNRNRLRKLAEQQVAEKFPDLPKGTDGWYRAVANRHKRLCKQW